MMIVARRSNARGCILLILIVIAVLVIAEAETRFVTETFHDLWDMIGVKN